MLFFLGRAVIRNSECWEGSVHRTPYPVAQLARVATLRELPRNRPLVDSGNPAPRPMWRSDHGSGLHSRSRWPAHGNFHGGHSQPCQDGCILAVWSDRTMQLAERIPTCPSSGPPNRYWVSYPEQESLLTTPYCGEH